ncbi:MAG: hypothetical protein K6E68_02570 [Lachnospiraceae bacterium]|nr:hypothetical protein [Lachnospiraceae bacterium]
MIRHSITDIHCHILYGVDDGSGDLDTSVMMLEQAYESGVRKMILTPHYKHHRGIVGQDELEERLKALKRYLKEHHMTMELYLGSEVLYYDEMTEGLDAGRINTMAGSRYVLTEFSPRADYRYIYNALLKILSSGYYPILAHIERYECMLKDMGHASELKESGVYIQVNADSVEGRNGMMLKRYSRKLISNDLVDFIASDAHDADRRRPVFQKVVKYLDRHFGADYTDRILNDNPAMIIANEYIH